MAAAKKNKYTLKRKVNPQHTKKEINQIIKDLLKWAHEDDRIYIASYVYEKYKKSKTWLYDLSTHYPELKEALETTRQLIAAKVANHSFKGDRNSTFGERILPMYCKDYKALLEWKAGLAKLSQDDSLNATDILKALAAGTLTQLITQKNEKNK